MIKLFLILTIVSCNSWFNRNQTQKLLTESEIEKMNEDLIKACEKVDFDEMKRLIHNGANVNYVSDENGRTPLMIVIEKDIKDSKKSAEFLIRKNADVNYSNQEYEFDGETALMIASSRGSNSIVHLLLNKGASIDAQSPKFGTAIIVAAKLNRGETLENLFAKYNEKHKETKKKIIDIKDKEGNTALIHAFKNKNVAIINLLINNGSDIQALSNLVKKLDDSDEFKKEIENIITPGATSAA